MMMAVNIKGENHKLYEYSDRDMAYLKVQTGQSYFTTNVCIQLATTIWYRQEKYSKQVTKKCNSVVSLYVSTCIWKLKWDL